jgi:hypothetical protein
MATITFDTLKFAERLEKAGLPREQASAIVEAQKESLAETLDTALATKMDIAAMRQEVELLRRDMDARFIQLEQRLIIKLGMLIAASIGIVAALVKLL